jgi:predicted dehydrogenase
MSAELCVNDRIRIGQLCRGGRSRGHVHTVKPAARQVPVGTVAVCDIWSVARERRRGQVKTAYNRAPQSYKYCEDMLPRKNIDGVMIVAGDFQHAKLCAHALKVGKDCYVEKPFSECASRC